MIGFIDVGGGMRGVYGAGVLDRCLDDGISFPYYLGVSAGAANIISFLGDHRGRTLRFYRDYSFHSEYMSFKNLIKTGDYLGLDYIYTTLTGEFDPLNYDRVMSKDCDFFVVTTDALTGETVYFNNKETVKNEYDDIKASCCVPLACHPRKIGDALYFDGGVSDPIPIKKALEAGCDKVVVVLTLPKDYYKKHKYPLWLYKTVVRKYPQTAVRMYTMIDKYNEGVDFLKKLEKQGKVLILSPDDCCKVTTLGRTKEGIETLYRKGYNDGEKIKNFLSLQEKISEQ